MILSDRVSGKVSAWGLLAAGFLALVALPAWSLAQPQPPQDGGLSVSDERAPIDPPPLSLSQVTAPKAPETTAPPVETASQHETTDARLQKLEAEIQRLSRLLAQPKPPWLQPRHVPNRLSQEARVYQYVTTSPVDAAAPVVIMGLGRTYVLTGADKGAYLTALNKDGRQIWLSHFPAPLPIRGDGVTWTLEEPGDKKQVILTWAKPNERITFHFDANSGQVLPEERALGDAVVLNPKNANPERPGDPEGIQSQSSRLERLEKAIEELRKQLQVPAPSRHSSSGSGAAYLQAVADLNLARSRVARLRGHDDAVGEAKMEEARIELERAQKLEQLLSAQIKAEMSAAEEARDAARAYYERAKVLSKNGAISQEELDAEKVALAEAEARVKQLESILPIKK